jgi:hypothetical protein
MPATDLRTNWMQSDNQCIKAPNAKSPTASQDSNETITESLMMTQDMTFDYSLLRVSADQMWKIVVVAVILVWFPLI